MSTENVNSAIPSMTRQLEALRAERDRLEADAERYRFQYEAKVVERDDALAERDEAVRMLRELCPASGLYPLREDIQAAREFLARLDGEA